MKNKEKQIEEMAKITCSMYCRNKEKKCANVQECDMKCSHHQRCEALYNAGYRKQRDIAKEIFDDIESKLLNHVGDYHGCYHKTFDELKRKYTDCE